MGDGNSSSSCKLNVQFRLVTRRLTQVRISSPVVKNDVQAPRPSIITQQFSSIGGYTPSIQLHQVRKTEKTKCQKPRIDPGSPPGDESHLICKYRSQLPRRCTQSPRMHVPSAARTTERQKKEKCGKRKKTKINCDKPEIFLRP